MPRRARASGVKSTITPLVDPSPADERHEGRRLAGEAQRLLRAEAEKAVAAQRIAEQAQRPVLQRAVEVDEHVAAGDELHLGEDAVGGQAVIGEHDVLPQRLVEHRPAVRGRVVVGERGFGAGLAVVAREARDAVDGIDARLRSFQRARVDVRRVDQRLLQQTLFAQQDGQRVRLLAGLQPATQTLSDGYVRSSGTTCSRSARK